MTAFRPAAIGTLDAPPRAGGVACRDLSVGYGGIPVLDGLDLLAGPAEIVALLGPSGSGKTTLLATIAGFLEPTAGEIWIGGRLVADASRTFPPEARRVGVVFQHFALWPHMTALQTVAYPLERRGLSARDARREALALLGRMGLERLANRRPAELSGGEQQRVGLARALARSPDVFLLDEPTAHLDAAIRGVLQQEIAGQCRGSGAAALYATHDVSEAFGVADRVVVLRDGRVVQEGSPNAVYERPVDEWTARLTGPASVVQVKVGAAEGGALEVSLEGATAVVPADGVAASAGEALLLIRPEWATLGGPLPGEVREVRYGGAFTDYTLQVGRSAVAVRAEGPPKLRPGERAGWRLNRIHLLTASDTATGAVDPEVEREGP